MAFVMVAPVLGAIFRTYGKFKRCADTCQMCRMIENQTDAKVIL